MDDNIREELKLALASAARLKEQMNQLLTKLEAAARPSSPLLDDDLDLVRFGSDGGNPDWVWPFPHRAAR